MATPRFQKGDFVIYKNNGLCRIEDIRLLTFGETKREYYILRPQSGGTVYVPTEGELAKKLQNAPTKKDIDDLIVAVETSDLKWIENSKLRIAAFDRLLASSDRKAILWIMKMLSAQKNTENKRLCSNEERILAMAEKNHQRRIFVCFGCSEGSGCPVHIGEDPKGLKKLLMRQKGS